MNDSGASRPRVVAGVGAHVDQIMGLLHPARPGESVPARSRREVGGCAFNLAAALAAMGRDVAHLGIRATDEAGHLVSEAMVRRGVDDAGLVLDCRDDGAVCTGTYVACVNPDGTLALAAADMAIYDRADELASSPACREAIASADVLILDANAPPGAIEALAGKRRADAKLVLLATSTRKAGALGAVMGEADLLFANRAEWDVLPARPSLAFVTDGARGAAIFVDGEETHAVASRAEAVAGVVGAGDAFAAGALDAWLGGAPHAEAVGAGLDCAARCLAHPGALDWLDSGHAETAKRTFGNAARAAPSQTDGTTMTPNANDAAAKNAELPMDVSGPVAEALEAGRAVVALESTIVTHGMPYPANLETARAVEADVKLRGAVPATIAVIEGRLCIGLSDDQLEALARAPERGEEVWKLSRADLAVALAAGRTGSTTVAATMIAARAAGIAVFATGGIGGVHRGFEDAMDVSADLDELARTPVIVVCAGAKAILDLPRTIEALETRGVPVIGYGTDDLPAFWSRRSGLPAPLRLDDPALIARAQRLRAALCIEGGTLVVNPVPEGDEIPAARVNAWIERALADADREGVSGKTATPFLLARINELSGGASLRTNVALVRNNARLAARIAVAAAR